MVPIFDTCRMMTRRADMSRRVIPAREALRIGFCHLRARLIGDFGVIKNEVPDLAQDRIGSKHFKLNTHSKSPFDLNIHTKNISLFQISTNF